MSKRLGSPCRSGRAESPGPKSRTCRRLSVMREAEEVVELTWQVWSNLFLPIIRALVQSG